VPDKRASAHAFTFNLILGGGNKKNRLSPIYQILIKKLKS
jgi:hypothetical protein